MTDEFKSTLFSYLIGRLPKENGTTEEIFKEINDIPRTSWENNEILPSLWNKFRYEGLIQVQDRDLLVLYGGYKTSDNQVRGIVTILNNDFTPVKTFFQFDSGTYLRYIQCMYQDSDGTFVAIDCPDYPEDRNWSFTTSQKRFLIFNNFTQQINNNYVLTLQKSYIMPQQNFYCKNIFKNPTSSQYVFTGSYLKDENDPDFDGVRVIEAKINVGSENEWNSIATTTNNYLYGNAYVEFEDDKFYCNIIMASTVSSSRNISCWTKNFTDSKFTLSSIKTFDFHPYIDSYNYQNQSVFLNKNEVFFVQNNQRWGVPGKPNAKYIGLYKYDILNSELTTIYEKYLGDYAYCNLEAIYIVANDNALYIEFNNNLDDTNYLADYYFQRLEDLRWNPIKISEQQFFLYNQRAIYVGNKFNLLNILLYPINPRLATWQVYNIKENYNASNYSGEPYINTNALIPNSAEIYSEENLVFARNLYNKTINNNTTVSTVEIPNTYLNGIDLTSKNLLSQTNLTMVEDTNVTQKNIYETMFLNFINVLQVADRNNVTQVLNQEASTYLNNAINTDDSYDNAKLYNKVIINYQDGSSKESSYSLENTTETSTVIAFGLYIDKLINNAEIVSNDKNTVYQTIDLSGLEVNKIYDIKQKLEVL